MSGDAISSAAYAAAYGGAPQMEAHHRVANHLSMIASYARLAAAEARADDSPEGHDRLEGFLSGLLGQLDAAAGLNRVLAIVEQPGEIDAATFFASVCTPLADLLEARARIYLAFEPGVCLAAQDAPLIGQFVAEAVTNAAKHAQHGDAPASIHVIGRMAAGRLAVVVADDGAGPPEGPAAGGLGGRLLRAIALRLNAELERGPGPLGYEVRLTLPA